MYYLLTESFKSQEAKLVEMITEAVPVEKIYMLGSSLVQRRTESIFMTDAPSCRKVGHYWLLVLIDKDCGHTNNDMQDRIENICRSFIPVTAIVLNLEQFNNWLNEGHRFATTVVKIAVKIYDGNEIPLVMPLKDLTNSKDDQSLWSQEYNVVNEFIAGAELYMLRNQNNMAMFMLHQATEQALHLIFKKGTGLHINTHNIEKLIRYCSMVSYKVEDIFPRDDQKNENLFQILQKAYISGRYKEGYNPKTVQIEMILNYVKKLKKFV
jgi:HEPN domain-containing protein